MQKNYFTPFSKIAYISGRCSLFELFTCQKHLILINVFWNFKTYCFVLYAQPNKHQIDIFWVVALLACQKNLFFIQLSWNIVKIAWHHILNRAVYLFAQLWKNWFLTTCLINACFEIVIFGFDNCCFLRNHRWNFQKSSHF